MTPKTVSDLRALFLQRERYPAEFDAALEREIPALLDRIEALEAENARTARILGVYQHAVNEIDDRIEYRRADHDFLRGVLNQIGTDLRALTGDPK